VYRLVDDSATTLRAPICSSRPKYPGRTQIGATHIQNSIGLRSVSAAASGVRHTTEPPADDGTVLDKAQTRKPSSASLRNRHSPTRLRAPNTPTHMSDI
jgi:hypothetical protein